MLSHDSGLRIVAYRASLMTRRCSLNSTGMLLVRQSAAAVSEALVQLDLQSVLTIACYNSGKDVVVGDTVVAEELTGTVGQEPLLELLALSSVLLGLGERDLVRAEGALDELAVDDLGTSPTLRKRRKLRLMKRENVATYLGGAEDQNGPAGLNERVAAASSLLDLVNLVESPLH